MRHDTHKAIGFLGYTILVKSGVFMSHNWLSPLWGLPLVMIFSTLPDVIERPFNLKHRGPTHSLTTLLCVGIFSSLLLFHQFGEMGTFLFWAIFASYGLHLGADILTDNGVCLFWPISKKRVKPGKYRLWYYRQGEGKEFILFVVTTLIAIIIWLYPALSILYRILVG